MNDSIITTKRLGDILELQRGYDLPTSKRTAGEVPIISSSGYSGYHNEHKCEGENVITGRYGTIGEVYYHSGKCWPLNTALFVKNFKGNTPKYVYYLLKNALSVYRVSGNDKSTVPGVDRKVIHEMLVPFHENMSYQQTVCSVLTCIDDKININNQVGLLLEAMAKTLYDYWFVQFDFPDENGKPYRTSGGEMVWNEQLKREIPKGWSAGTLSEYITGDKNGDWGKEHKQGNYTKKVTCIRGADLPAMSSNKQMEAPTRYILEKNASKHLCPGDIIVEISGGSPTQSTGRICYINEITMHRFQNDIIVSNFCRAFTTCEYYEQYWFYLLWKSLYDAGVLFGYEGKTTGIKNLLFDMFCTQYKIVSPDKSVIERFHSIVCPIFEKVQKCKIENDELTKLRDWLLPMLMNGQARVE